MPFFCHCQYLKVLTVKLDLNENGDKYEIFLKTESLFPQFEGGTEENPDVSIVAGVDLVGDFTNKLMC
jgi:hypothetical protein